MSNKFSTDAVQNLVKMLSAPKAVVSNPVVAEVEHTPKAVDPITLAICREDYSMTIAGLRKKANKGTLWGGEKNKEFSGLHRRFVQRGLIPEDHTEDNANARNAFSQAMPGGIVDDTLNAAMAEAIVELASNMTGLASSIKTLSSKKK